MVPRDLYQRVLFFAKSFLYAISNELNHTNCSEYYGLVDREIPIATLVNTILAELR